MGSCNSLPRSPAMSPAYSAEKTAGDDANGSCMPSKRWTARMKLKGGKEKRGGGGRRTSGDGEDDEIQRLREIMIYNGGSDVAYLYNQQGKKGTNQDAMIVWENFTLRSDTIFCGVFDGHGPFGHVVAKTLRDSLPLKLSIEWGANLSGHENSNQSDNMSGNMNSEETSSFRMDDDCCDFIEADAKERVPEMLLPLKQSFLKSFKSMDKELKFHPIIDCFCSGSTAVTLVKQGQELVIGNLGDSRAIMATRDKDNNLVAEQLTVDLKPNLPREAARIQQCKGRVFALHDEPEVARVWLPNSDSPGLAMARAFGDFCLKDYGLISVPDITYRHLSEKDEFIVLATDGVWDVLTNKEVIDIVASAPTRQTAARAIVDCAVRAWKIKFPTSKSDDCAVVCLFLESSSPVLSQQGNSTAALESAKLPNISTPNEDADKPGVCDVMTIRTHSTTSNLEFSSTSSDVDEIVPVPEEIKVEKIPERSQSTRSLAECISTAEDEEWSALEGVTRVNSLVNLPRFLSGDKKSHSWRKWL